MSEGAFSSTDLHRLRRQLDSWRRRQTGRHRLPRAFWDAAAQLAGVRGISCVARTLQVGFVQLRKHTRALAPVARTPFVEFKPDASACGLGATGSVELFDGPQRRLRPQTGDDPALWLSLAEAFWRARA